MILKPSLSIVLFLLCIASTMVHAHKGNEAFFTIEIQEEQTLVQVELPWTIRNALLAYDSSWVENRSKQGMMEAFNRYIRSNFKLYDVRGKELDYRSIQAKSSDGHSAFFELTFAPGKIGKVWNTTLFSYSNKQMNFHFIKTNNASPYTTTIGQPWVVIMPLDEREHYWEVAIGLAVFVAFGGWLIIRQTRKK